MNDILPVDQNPHLQVELHVKFRFLGMDIGKVDFSQAIPLPLPSEFVTTHHQLVSLSQRGVSLSVSLAPPALPTVAMAAPIKAAPVLDIYGNPFGTLYTIDSNGNPVPVKVAPAAAVVAHVASVDMNGLPTLAAG